MTKWHRRYVDTVVRFDASGRVMPVEIIWDDRHRYKIDSVTDIRPKPALRAGGQGDCYTVEIICGDDVQTRQLFFERNAALSGSTLGRWFVEAPEQN